RRARGRAVAASRDLAAAPAGSDPAEGPGRPQLSRDQPHHEPLRNERRLLDPRRAEGASRAREVAREPSARGVKEPVMKIHPDDPRLPAYALGELAAEERAQIEAWLATSPEGRRAVDEIRETSAALANELRAESAPPLAAAQRQSIARAARNH